MAIDPTGYDKALAQIQPGALSERQQRIAAALALVRDGMSGLKAARAVGVPYSTLWGYIHDVSKLGNFESDGREIDLRSLDEASIDVALIAAEAVRDELVNNRDAWKPADLVRAYAAATDRVIALRQGGQSQSDGMSELSKLLQGMAVTLTPRPDGDRAIEAIAERIG